jgi:hypothetical protein
MQTILQKTLQESKHIPKTNNLEEFLFVSVQKSIEKNIRIKFFSYTTMGFVSSLLLYTYSSSFYNDLASSGFYDYIRLIVSEDLSTLALSSKELVYAIFESLPMMEITLSLGLLFTVMVSVNGVLTSLKRNQLHRMI